METKISFIEAFFGNGASAGEYVAFMLMSTITMALYKYLRWRQEIQKNPSIGFSWKTWRKENGLDFFAAIVSAFLIFRFLPDATSFLNFGVVQDKMAYGAILGFAIQYVWHQALKRVNVVIE